MAISVAPVRPDPNLDVPQYALDVEDLLVLARSEKEDIKYREVQLNSTMETEVFHILLESRVRPVELFCVSAEQICR